MAKTNISILLAALFVVAVSMEVQAKKRPKNKGFYSGQNTVKVGIGYPSLINTSKKELNVFGEVKRGGMPPVKMSFESAVSDNMSFGGFLAFSKEKATVTDRTNPDNVNGFNYTFTVVGATAALHMKVKNKKADPYASALLGYTLAKGTPFGENNFFDEPKGMLAYGAHVGANYYLDRGFAIFGEVGYGFAIVNAGITIRF